MPDGIWRYETTKGPRWGVRLKFKRTDGIWRERTWRGFDSQKQAILFRDQQRHLRIQAKFFPNQEPLAETIRKYLATSKHKKSHADDIRYANWWSTWFGMAHPITSITVDHLEQARTNLKLDKSNATVNRYVHFLRHIFNYAKDRGILNENIVSRLDTLPEPPAPTLYLTDDQEAALKTAMGKWWPWARFAIITGMRSGEQFNLKWVDIDWDNRVAVLHQTKSGRTVYKPLTDEAIAILKAIPRKHERIFHCGVSRWMSTNFKPACRSANLPNTFTWHTLRHTYGSRLGMAGASALEIGQLLGHTSPAMATRYTHFSQEHLRRVLERGGRDEFN